MQKPKAQVIADHYELENQTVKAMEELAEQMMYFYDIGEIELETVMDIKMDRQLHRMKEGD